MFDLDNTLYPPPIGLLARIGRRMTDWVMQNLQIDRAGADNLRATHWQTYKTTLSGLMRHHGADPVPCLACVHDIDFSVLPTRPGPPRPDHAARIRAARTTPPGPPGPDRAARIRALPGRRIVCTNAGRACALRGLKARGG